MQIKVPKLHFPRNTPSESRIFPCRQSERRTDGETDRRRDRQKERQTEGETDRRDTVNSRNFTTAFRNRLKRKTGSKDVG